MTLTAQSRGGVSIRLTDERWAHIVEEHAELAGLRENVLETISDAERVLAGQAGALMAVRSREQGKLVVVVYHEVSGATGLSLPRS
jgi:hypothetical protein